MMLQSRNSSDLLRWLTSWLTGGLSFNHSAVRRAEKKHRHLTVIGSGLHMMHSTLGQVGTLQDMRFSSGSDTTFWDEPGQSTSLRIIRGVSGVDTQHGLPEEFSLAPVSSSCTVSDFEFGTKRWSCSRVVTIGDLSSMLLLLETELHPVVTSDPRKCIVCHKRLFLWIPEKWGEYLEITN